jgi:hypothetical protein
MDPHPLHARPKIPSCLNVRKKVAIASLGFLIMRKQPVSLPCALCFAGSHFTTLQLYALINSAFDERSPCSDMRPKTSVSHMVQF